MNNFEKQGRMIRQNDNLCKSQDKLIKKCRGPNRVKNKKEGHRLQLKKCSPST